LKYLTLLVFVFLLSACAKFEPITQDDINSYGELNKIKIVDYTILDEQSALILEVDGSVAQVSTITKRKNKSITPVESMSAAWNEDEEGVSVERALGYFCVVVHDKAVEHDMDFVIINYLDDNGVQKDRFDLNGKQGVLIKMDPKYEGGGMVAIYGNDGFIQEKMYYP